MQFEKGPGIDTSQFCQEDEHVDCGHQYGQRARLFGKQPEANAVLCRCECHVGCPLAADEYVPMAQWIAECTCPGAVEAKAWHVEYDRATEEREAHVKEIRASIEIVGTKSRSDYRSELERAYEARGIEPTPYELDMAAGLMEAASGPAYLAGARVVGTFGRFVSSAIGELRKAFKE
jgi:hypothetical protein